MTNAEHIHIKKTHEGRLHRALHVPQGQKIPLSKIVAAEHSSNPRLREEAQFAENARHFKRK
ncbi:MAG: hypothetical protein ACREUG_09220 [Steroidobacteraceae bacterium]